MELGGDGTYSPSAEVVDFAERSPFFDCVLSAGHSVVCILQQQVSVCHTVAGRSKTLVQGPWEILTFLDQGATVGGCTGQTL